MKNSDNSPDDSTLKMHAGSEFFYQYADRGILYIYSSFFKKFFHTKSGDSLHLRNYVCSTLIYSFAWIMSIANFQNSINQSI